MKYTRFRMIMQFSLLCRKKTTCCEQSLENDKKRYVFKYLRQLIDILTSLMSLLPSSAGIMDCRRILVVLRRIFGCSYGTWKKDSKMQKFKYAQETAGLLCSKRPRYEKIKNKCKISEALMSSKMLCHISEQ